jgi:hypothetical protein
MQEQTAAAGPHDLRVASVLNNLGSVRVHARQYREGVMFYEKSLEVMKHVVPGSLHPQAASTHQNAAAVLSSYLQDHRGALRHALEALRIYRALYGNEVAVVALIINNVGELYRVRRGRKTTLLPACLSFGSKRVRPRAAAVGAVRRC